MAVVRLGFVRATEDIDLLVEGSSENVARVRAALMTLPDGAVHDMEDDDLERYAVVRIVDEITVDLIVSTCGIRYEEAEPDIERATVGGVEIPFASAALLLRMKQTGREKDALDAMFLERVVRGEDPGDV